MTEEVWSPDGMSAGKNPEDFFNVREAQGHLLIVWVRDEVLRFSTKDCPDGMKLLMRGPNKGRYVNNNVVRATIADLSISNPVDGQPGKVFEEAVIFAGTLVKDLKNNVGKKLLLVWNQDDPTDKSSPYSYGIMNENPDAVAAARAFTERHPEFWATPEPSEYKLPDPQGQQQQQGQQSPAQPQGQWNQQSGTQGYPQAQQAQGQSFLSRVQGQAEWVQHQPQGTQDHHGQPQATEAPF